jgi:hypothetical protein
MVDRWFQAQVLRDLAFHRMNELAKELGTNGPELRDARMNNLPFPFRLDVQMVTWNGLDG